MLHPLSQNPYAFSFLLNYTRDMLTRYLRRNLSTVSLPSRYGFSRKIGVVNSLLYSFQEINHARGENVRMSAGSPAMSKHFQCPPNRSMLWNTAKTAMLIKSKNPTPRKTKALLQKKEGIENWPLGSTLVHREYFPRALAQSTHAALALTPITKSTKRVFRYEGHTNYLQ